MFSFSIKKIRPQKERKTARKRNSTVSEVKKNLERETEKVLERERRSDQKPEVGDLGGGGDRFRGASGDDT